MPRDDPPSDYGDLKQHHEFLRPRRLFWETHKAALVGLPIVAAICFGLVAAAGFFAPHQPAVGVVAVGGGRQGVKPTAIVRVDGHLMQIHVVPSDRCRVGTEIDLMRRRGLLGPQYTLAYQPQACRPG